MATVSRTSLATGAALPTSTTRHNPIVPVPRVKITVWRLFNSFIILSFGSFKAASAYLGFSTFPTTLEWILGVVWALFAYWASLIEVESRNTAAWLFQEDLVGSDGLADALRLLLWFTALIVYYIGTIMVANLYGDPAGFLQTEHRYSVLGGGLAVLLAALVTTPIILLFLYFVLSQFELSDWRVSPKLTFILWVILSFTLIYLPGGKEIALAFYQLEPVISVPWLALLMSVGLFGAALVLPCFGLDNGATAIALRLSATSVLYR
ncbi:hypothetical protein CPB83DRAFT_834240 [Crepidotus variabilis]|uniref:Uncharacterized protein n=1 Tax=Crepidotus variabilis TaxID=179855 RepID=A0A9P6JSJ2_9AGAR|nr:hypothetical protein CPB83DRAFT_834240 [Crepidotus variabilis]